MSDRDLSLKDLLGALAPDRETLAPDGPELDAVVRDLPDVDPAGVKTAVGEAVAGVLDVRTADVVTGVWSRLAELRQAADPRKHPPEEIVVVALAKHTIVSEHHPTVEVRVNDVPVAEVLVDLTLALTMEGVHLKVRDGRLREVTAGRVGAEASLAVAGQSVLGGATPPIDLPGRIDFGPDGWAVPVLRRVPAAARVQTAAAEGAGPTTGVSTDAPAV